jgi:iron complex outermembrane receptor protein
MLYSYSKGNAVNNSSSVLQKVVAGVVAVAAMAAVEARDAYAQTLLPGIVVTTPSPVVRAPPKAAQPPVPTSVAAQATPLPSTGIIAEDAFVPITVVPSNEITSTPGANLANSLQYRPGITGSNFAPGANRPVIRGLDNFRVRVQENGIGSHDVSALSEDHAVPIDPFAADHIEVVRGPATLRYGSQAIGGVVSAINDRIPEIIPPRGFSIETRGGLNSVDSGADGAFKVTAGAGSFAVHADAFKRRAGDYDTPQGRMANSFVDNQGFSVGGSLIGPGGFVGVAFTRYDALYGIPGEDARIDMLQDKFQSRGEWRVGSMGIEAIRTWFGVSDYEHREIVPGEGIGSIFTNKESEGRVEVQHLPIMTAFGELRGAVGTQFGRRKTLADSLEGDDLLAPARTNTVAAFIFEELQATKRLRLQAAVRIEHTSVDGSGLVLTAPNAGDELATERTFRPFSASAGILYQLPMGVVARLTGQYVERAPDAAELFSKGVHEATQTFEIGNPFLTKEKAQSFELGFRKAKGPFRFDASVYYTKFNGFIFKQLTDAQCGDELNTCAVPPPDEELRQILFQQRDATFTGAELLVQLDVAPIWRGLWGIDGQYDFVRASFDDAQDGNVPRIPPHRAGAGVYYRDLNWFARVGVLHAFDQNRIGTEETPTDAYTLLNADLAYTFRLNSQGNAIPEMTIGLKGENLLDDDVRNHVSFLKDEVLQPGRTIRLYGIVKLN